MLTRFIKVRKSNKSHDRGFIAVDAICSVFENKENHNVSIMTMDGFWYDVEDDVDTLYSLITSDNYNKEYKQRDITVGSKKDYYRKKKMLPAFIANEKTAVNQDEICKTGCDNGDMDENKMETMDVFKKTFRVGGGNRLQGYRRKEKNLSAGADEGHNNQNPTLEKGL